MFTRLKNKVWRFIYNAAKAGADAALNEDAADIKLPGWRTNSTRETRPRYLSENAELHKVFDTREALLDHLLGLTPNDGMILEFGVYRGHSLRQIGERLPHRQVFGFDSFEGLPEPWIFNQKGIFSDVNGALPRVPDNAVLIKGFFQQTSPDFLAKHPGPIALLHVDSDIYSSCKYVLETYGDRIDRRPSSPSTISTIIPAGGTGSSRPSASGAMPRAPAMRSSASRRSRSSTRGDSSSTRSKSRCGSSASTVRGGSRWLRRVESALRRDRRRVGNIAIPAGPSDRRSPGGGARSDGRPRRGHRGASRTGAMRSR